MLMEVETTDVASRGQLDMAVTTARKYPRSIKAFQSKVLDMATLDVETAQGCFYKLPRANKIIEGPSIRFLEICAASYQNIRYGSRIVREEADFVVTEGAAIDLENNVSSTVEVRRRITNKDGKRYNDDMIQTTSMAASAIARRNALRAVIPEAMTRRVYEAVKRVAIGDAKTLGERRQSMVTAYTKLGVSLEQILVKVGKAGLEDISLEDVELLIGIGTAIREGDTSIDEQFPPIVKQPAPAPEAAAAPAPQAPAAANGSPAAPAAPAKALTPLQEFNALEAKVKKAKGREVVAEIMERHGFAKTFPSKIPEEGLRTLIAEFSAILNPSQEG